MPTLKTPRRYATRGWTLIGTGGNCVALERRLASGKSLMATAASDAGLAPYAGAEVVVGLYGSDHSEPLHQLQVSYRAFLLRTALAWIAEVEAAFACPHEDTHIIDGGRACAACGQAWVGGCAPGAGA